MVFASVHHYYPVICVTCSCQELSTTAVDESIDLIMRCTFLKLMCAAATGVLVGLIGEWATGLGLLEQTADHPLIVFGSFLLLSFASYVPLSRWVVTVQW